MKSIFTLFHFFAGSSYQIAQKTGDFFLPPKWSEVNEFPWFLFHFFSRVFMLKKLKRRCFSCPFESFVDRETLLKRFQRKKRRKKIKFLHAKQMKWETKQRKSFSCFANYWQGGQRRPTYSFLFCYTCFNLVRMTQRLNLVGGMLFHNLCNQQIIAFD